MKRAVLVLVVALAGCAGAQTSDTSTDRPALIRACEPLYYEPPGLPDVVIASDLPMRGAQRTAMMQLSQAIKVAIKDREFRTGAVKVGYLVCDDSGPDGMWSKARCDGNAHAYVRTRNIVGVIGTLDSGCARVELPTLNAAGIVLLSPLNTATDLTRDPRFAQNGRSYARLVPPEETQASLLARWVRDRGARKAAVLDDGSVYGRRVSSWFASAARALGLEVVPTGADAVFVGGTLSQRIRALLERARTRGRMLVLPDGYAPVTLLSALAGGVAEGAFVGVPGVPVERLPSSGRSFARRFERLLGRPPHPYAVYGAQAALVLLRAIAESGTGRDAVRRGVLATRLEDGLVGPVAFDEHGDPVPAALTVFRVTNGMPRYEEVVESAVP